MDADVRINYAAEPAEVPLMSNSPAEGCIAGQRTWDPAGPALAHFLGEFGRADVQFPLCLARGGESCTQTNPESPGMGFSGNATRNWQVAV